MYIKDYNLSTITEDAFNYYFPYVSANELLTAIEYTDNIIEDYWKDILGTKNKVITQQMFNEALGKVLSMPSETLKKYWDESNLCWKYSLENDALDF